MELIYRTPPLRVSFRVLYGRISFRVLSHNCTPPVAFLHAKGRALTERIERLAKETGEAAEQHQQEETAARKKKAKVEVELAAVVGKYDRDMAEKTAQIKEIKVCENTPLPHGSPSNITLPPFAHQAICLHPQTQT